MLSTIHNHSTMIIICISLIDAAFKGRRLLHWAILIRYLAELLQSCGFEKSQWRNKIFVFRKGMSQEADREAEAKLLAS